MRVTRIRIVLEEIIQNELEEKMLILSSLHLLPGFESPRIQDWLPNVEAKLDQRGLHIVNFEVSNEMGIIWKYRVDDGPLEDENGRYYRMKFAVGHVHALVKIYFEE